MEGSNSNSNSNSNTYSNSYSNSNTYCNNYSYSYSYSLELALVIVVIYYYSYLCLWVIINSYLDKCRLEKSSQQDRYYNIIHAIITIENNYNNTIIHYYRSIFYAVYECNYYKHKYNTGNEVKLPWKILEKYLKS